MFGLHASSCRLLVKYKIDLKSRTVRISGVGRSDDTLGTKKMDLLWRNICIYVYIYILILQVRSCTCPNCEMIIQLKHDVYFHGCRCKDK